MYEGRTKVGRGLQQAMHDCGRDGHLQLRVLHVLMLMCQAVPSVSEHEARATGLRDGA